MRISDWSSDVCSSDLPPVPICPACRSRAWEPKVVSGRATVVGVTVNAHPWMPTMPPPYVIANVALEEDASVRLTTNVVACEPDDVRLGQAVAVRSIGKASCRERTGPHG